MNRSVAVANGKGGVGKTSTACNLAGLTAASGARVLVIDSDPQGHVALNFGYDIERQTDQGASMLKAVLTGGLPDVTKDVRPNLDVIWGGEQLEELAIHLNVRRMSGRGGAGAYSETIKAIAAQYDFVFVDCPPGGHILQEGVFGAARWVLVPAKTDKGSLAGLRDIARRFDVAHEINPDLELLGVFLFGTQSSARRVIREARADILKELEGLDDSIVLTSFIRQVEAAARDEREMGLLAHELEAAAEEAEPWYVQRQNGKSDALVVARSSSSLAGDYSELAREVHDRIAKAEALLAGTSA
ncbi:ParA family protein [Kineosporia sp. A_224]|uniref:ParA family protein n=1 Tax=Kineosporia sp. A_224 TaxID=1962180 RepID=UPI000B4AFC93|nr:ParA family protein [Kineosporia sp. A_224]